MWMAQNVDSNCPKYSSDHWQAAAVVSVFQWLWFLEAGCKESSASKIGQYL